MTESAARSKRPTARPRLAPSQQNRHRRNGYTILSLWLLALCAGGITAGCIGTIVDGDPRASESTPAETGSGGDPAVDKSGPTAGIGPATKGSGENDFRLSDRAYLSPRLRMKSVNEILRAIKEAFGFEVKNPTLLPEDPIDPSTGFSNISSQLQVGEVYYLGLEKLARIVGDGASVESLLRFCTEPNASDAACANAFVTNYGKILFGRNLEPADKESLLRVYTESRAINQSQIALRDVLETMIQMPSFIYRTEFGNPTATRGPNKLAPLEMAAALSSYFWEGPPDAELLKAAESGLLVDSSQLATHARRLFKDPRARPAFAKFVELWLAIGKLGLLSKDTKLFPTYTPSLADAMLVETQTLAENIVFNGDSSLKSLFVSDKTYLNEKLSQFYKISVGSVKGVNFMPVDLPSERRGILSHGSLLASTGGDATTSPIVRGLFVRRSLLCGTLPPPPPGVAATAEADTGKKSKRELFNQHLSPACSPCHALINPLGFGLENFDSVGRYRTTERGEPVDSSGTLANQDGTEVKAFSSGEGFLSALAESSELASCFVLRAYQFALGRPAGIEDKPVLTGLAKKFRSDNYNIANLITEIVTSSAFTTRAAQD